MTPDPRGRRRHHPYCVCPACEDARGMVIVTYALCALVLAAVVVGWLFFEQIA